MSRAVPGPVELDEAALRAAFEAPSSPERDRAMRRIARHADPRQLLELVADHKSAGARNGALAALERQGPIAVPVLEQVLASPDADDDLVMFALQVLARIGGPGSVPQVSQLLQHPNDNVVQAAIEALGQLRAVQAIPALIARAGDDPWVQLAVINALGDIGSPVGIPWLLRHLDGSPLIDTALVALGSLALAHPTAPETAAALARVAEAGTSHDVASSLAALVASDAPMMPGSVTSTATLVLAAPVPIVWPHALDALWRNGGWTAAAQVVAPHRARLVPLVVEALAHPSPSVRAAALALDLLGPADANPIVAALHDPDGQVRAEACRAAGRCTLVTAVPLLVERLAGESREEQVAAVGALARMPATALEALAGSLGPDAPASLVIRALEVLEQVTPESLAPRAVELTSHRVPDVRRAALRVTARIGGPRADQILLKALGDVHLGVQEEAIELLVAKGGERMVDTFIGLLSLPNSLRFRVIRALGRLGVPRASAKLEALSRDCALHERLEIIVALTRIQPPSLRDFLQRELGDANVEIRRAAARGFGVIAEVQDLGVLTRLALDDDWTLRNEAARGLGRLPAAESEQLLLDLARDTESVVARSARQVLANRRDRDVAGAA